jgi:hypothetical protein
MTPRRLLKLILPPVLVLIPLWLAGRLLIAMNADPPVREAVALKGALEGARRARAKEFCPNEFRTAEAYVQQALSFHYRTISEKTGFLNYDLVRARLGDARSRVDLAWKKARRTADAARTEASRLIAEGNRALDQTQAALRSLPIGAVVRTNLARAQVAMGSAEVRWRNGDFAGAARDATFAKTTSDEIRRRADGFVTHYTNGAAAQRWARWISDTIEVSRRSGDYVILVDKLKHKCHLYRGGVLVRSYDADLGGPLWDKMRAGDRATPEGMYRVVRKRAPGQTVYYKALLINYPNDEDRAQFAIAKRNGWVSRGAGIGGLIEIHGEGGRKEDWTLGCVALANRDMDELFRLVDIGTPVTIVGTITRSVTISG